MRTLEKELITQGYTHIVGVDEAGRGPLAGPVVAAAVMMPLAIELDHIVDSKKLSQRKREASYAQLFKYGQIGIGVASPQEIDTVNILQATFLAMKRAIKNLPEPPDYCLIDGNLCIPDFSTKQQALVRGDANHYLIAAASIVAKVYRDRIMTDYHLEYPQYGFDRHKGYPTKKHYSALDQYGPSPIHRYSFQGVRRGIIS